MARTPTAVGGAVVPTAELPPPVRTYFAALDAEDLTRLATVWSDTAELCAVGARPRRGPDDVMGYYRTLFEPWASHEDRPTRAIVAGDVAVVEVRFTGITHAGAQVSFDAVDVFDLAGDAIARLACWYDLAWVRRQL